MNQADLLASIDKYWEEKIIPTLKTYIEIPAKSPAFDANWKKSGHLDRVLKLVDQWVEDRKIPGLKKEILVEENRTPLLLLELPGDLDYQVLMYGHLDKQPEMSGWSEGLGPWQAVRREDRLYGRGGADDGYAVFASICAIEHLLRTDSPRPHIRVAIEFSEESGSPDLPVYFEKQSKKFGTPDLIICLDSGAGNYEQFWTTTSLRGLISANLKVQVLNEGVHSGDASGVVPSSFRVIRMLLNRLENVDTGEVLPTVFKAEVPRERMVQIERTAKELGDDVYKKFPLAEKMEPAVADPKELILNRTWRAALSVVGAEGLPELEKAGNVLRPSTTLKLSLRLPPTVKAAKAAAELKKLLEKDPPYNASVELEVEDSASGWDAPPMQKELDDLIQETSRNFYKKEALAMGEGGSIPFMGMLGEKFPKAQFVITGVLGPNSNAHGPNEFIHLGFAKKLTASIAYMLMNCKRLKKR
jgi:acetylornithine deacetylase/succinyl-diaminopimelate desuccinylase-like protein